MSQKLKFLTGDETLAMMEAHLQAGLVVGEPFVDRYEMYPRDWHPCVLLLVLQCPRFVRMLVVLAGFVFVVSHHTCGCSYCS